jgi:hypothetical protein
VLEQLRRKAGFVCRRLTRAFTSLAARLATAQPPIQPDAATDNATQPTPAITVGLVGGPTRVRLEGLTA